MTTYTSSNMGGPPLSFTFSLPQPATLIGYNGVPITSPSPTKQMQPLSFQPLGPSNSQQIPTQGISKGNPAQSSFFQSSPQRVPQSSVQTAPTGGPSYGNQGTGLASMFSFQTITPQPLPGFRDEPLNFGVESLGNTHSNNKAFAQVGSPKISLTNPKPQEKNFENKLSQADSKLASDIVEVYEDNFFEELQKLSDISQTFNYVAMDTEFPGDVYDGDSQYLLVRENVNNLKLIQLGITLSNEKGEFPHPTSTWQFNFKFDIRQEKWNRSSIELLMRSGINFDLLAAKGISHQCFAEYFLTSGLLMNRDMHWYGFHTDHDFGYLQRMLTGIELPFEEKQFLDELLILFPNFYDIKVIADNSLGMYRGSLAALSERLNVIRDDKCEHQAGSDSKITAKCFIELQKMSTKSCNMILASHGEIYGLSRSKKSPQILIKEKAQRILPGTNVKPQLSSNPPVYESSQDNLFEAQTNSISPPHQMLFRPSSEVQELSGAGFTGLGLEFDNSLDLDHSGIYGDEDPYFLYDNYGHAAQRNQGHMLQLHPTVPQQLSVAQSFEYQQQVIHQQNQQVFNYHQASYQNVYQPDSGFSTHKQQLMYQQQHQQQAQGKYQPVHSQSQLYYQGQTQQHLSGNLRKPMPQVQQHPMGHHSTSFRQQQQQPNHVQQAYRHQQSNFY